MSSRPLLEAHVSDAEYVDPGSDLGDELRRLSSRVTALERDRDQVKRDAVIVVLNLLAKSLKHVASGQFDLDDVGSSSDNSKWDAVKRRLPPRHAEAIDMLMLQGSMRRRELSAALKMNYTNCVNNLIGPLIRQGWIMDNGGQLSLKQL